MNIKDWEKGKLNEIKFWDNWLLLRGKMFEKDNRLIDRFNPMIGNKKKVKIANLGSGAVCTIGNKRKDIDIEVVSSDILADEFHKIIKKLDLKPVCKVEKEDMTKLSYQDESFDIVYCANALDHCQDPYKALKEIVRICKPGGWVYLYHIAHEGQRHRYHGLHKWNLDRTEDGDCIIWDNSEGPKTNAFLLSEIYPGFTNNLKLHTKAAFIISVVQKK